VRLRSLVAGVVALLGLAGTIKPASAQSDPPSIDLVVSAGRPLRVALDERIQLKTVGKLVTGTETEPVYAYNRIVIPVGAGVRGHVVPIDSGSKLVRARAYLNGNFLPPKHVTRWFLFERVQVPNQAPTAPLGALHAIDVGSADRVAVEDEGGTTVENSKTRFVAPALSQGR
jgi:hypothetical protein